MDGAATPEPQTETAATNFGGGAARLRDPSRANSVSRTGGAERARARACSPQLEDGHRRPPLWRVATNLLDRKGARPAPLPEHHLRQSVVLDQSGKRHRYARAPTSSISNSRANSAWAKPASWIRFLRGHWQRRRRPRCITRGFCRLRDQLRASARSAYTEALAIEL